MHAHVSPDYHGNSIVNLMASLVRARGGGDTGYDPLAGLDTARLSACRNIVLLVIDGLGYDYLKSRAAPCLKSHLARHATSVFPSSTASAITSFFTAQAPQQHGLVGWHVYFEELENLLAVLPFRPRYGFPPLAPDDASGSRVFTSTPVFNLITAAAHVVAPERIIHSQYNLAHSGKARRTAYLTRSDLFAAVARIARTAAEPQFIYAYYPELDRIAHERGIASTEAEVELAAIDQACARLLDELSGSDTALIVTADHGFIDIPGDRIIDLESHPRFAQTLRRPLAGEQRIAYCYVREERHDEFIDYANSHFSDALDVMSGRDLIGKGYFGLGESHPKLLSRVGDYALVMKDGYAIKDWVPGERRYVHVGFHGGLSAAEMHVPVVVAVV